MFRSLYIGHEIIMFDCMFAIDMGALLGKMVVEITPFLEETRKITARFEYMRHIQRNLSYLTNGNAWYE